MAGYVLQDEAVRSDRRCWNNAVCRLLISNARSMTPSLALSRVEIIKQERI